MASKSFLRRFDTVAKNLQYKKRIAQYFILNGADTLNALSKELDISVPTASKFVSEMCNTGLLKSYGKLETSGGRHPVLYGLAPEACYFVGVDFAPDSIRLSVMDFTGQPVHGHIVENFSIENTPECLEMICQHVEEFIERAPMREDIVSIGMNLFGRLNPTTGYSYTYFNFSEVPLGKSLSERFGLTTFIDNDSRAAAYGEYMVHYKEKGLNMLFVNIAWGLGLGIIIDGEPYSGKSGFSGEFGHIYAHDNEVICRCGKKGCLETEASGFAMHRKFLGKIQAGANSILLENEGYTIENGHKVTLEELVQATRKEDMLCIEILEEVGEQLGIHLSGLINLFNPNVVVIGGILSETGDYIMQPLIAAIRKYSLNMVSQDTSLCLSLLQQTAGVMGACMLARKKLISSLEISD